MDASVIKMDKNVTHMILNLTLETIYILTGEDYEVMKKTSGDDVTSHLSGALNRSQTTNPSPPSIIQEKKILELTNQVIHILTGEVWKFLGQGTLGNYTRLKESVPLPSHDLAHEDSSTCSIEESFSHELDLSADKDRTSHDLYQGTPLPDSDISKPNLIKEEQIVAEKHLQPRQQTSEDNISSKFSHEDGQQEQLDYYSPVDDTKYISFVIKEEQEEGDHSHPDLNPFASQATSLDLSDKLTTLENIDTNLASIGNIYSTLPSHNPKQQTNTSQEFCLNSNDTPGFSGDLTRLGPSRTEEKPETSLSKRLMILRKGKTFFCSECGKSSSWRSVLIHHQRIHTGEKPYSCFECGKCFKTKTHLILHQRTHTGEKPYSCLECEKSFTCSSHLARHKRVHTGEKPYFCSQCNKSFNSNSNLIRHQTFHTGERPYFCPDCGKRYRYNSELTRHQRRRPNGNPYSCSECGICYFSKCALAVHLQGHGLAPGVLKQGR